MIAPKMPSRTLDICDVSTRIVPVQKAFSLITRRSTKTDGPRIQAKNRPCPLSRQPAQASPGEDSLPQPPYVILDPMPLHGIPVDDLVLRSVHRHGVQLAHRFWRLPIVWSSQD